MPVYEYHCQACGKDLEKIVTYNARDLPSCPNCGARLTRLLSTFQFRMGDNWHKGSNIASDGEGFTTQHYSRDEYNYRVKNNLAKGDKV